MTPTFKLQPATPPYHPLCRPAESVRGMGRGRHEFRGTRSWMRDGRAHKENRRRKSLLPTRQIPSSPSSRAKSSGCISTRLVNGRKLALVSSVMEGVIARAVWSVGRGSMHSRGLATLPIGCVSGATLRPTAKWRRNSTDPGEGKLFRCWRTTSYHAPNHGRNRVSAGRRHLLWGL